MEVISFVAIAAGLIIGLGALGACIGIGQGCFGGLKQCHETYIQAE